MSASNKLFRISDVSAHFPEPVYSLRRSLTAAIPTLFCLIGLIGLIGRVHAAEPSRLVFNGEDIAGWQTKSFKGHTDYKLVWDNGRKVVQAESRGSASGLFKKVTLEPTKFRYLRWSWKISRTIEKGFERTKKGDDYAARVYVVFPGRFFWQTKAINYIWANHLPKGDHIPNAFTPNAMMVAVESGPKKAGLWLDEERDVLADYRLLFNEEPRQIGAIAIMTDTDNSATEATAWYGDISISAGKF